MKKCINMIFACRKAALLAFLFLTSSHLAIGQVTAVLTTPTEGRAVAMGGATTGVVGDAFSTDGNAASLLFTDNKVLLSGGFTSWMPTLTTSTLFSGSGFYRVSDKVGVAINYCHNLNKELTIVDGDGLPIGLSKPTHLFGGVSAQYLILPNLSAAVGVNYLRGVYNIDALSPVGGVVGDLSLFYRSTFADVGMRLKSLGTISDGSSLPTTLSLGASRRFEIAENHTLLPALDIALQFENSAFQLGAGLEYSFKEMIYLMGGYHWGDKELVTPPYASVGLGLAISVVKVEGAYFIVDSASPLSNSFTISLKLQL